MKKINKKNVFLLILLLAVLVAGGFGISRMMQNNQEQQAQTEAEDHSGIEFSEEEVIEIDDEMDQGGF